MVDFLICIYSPQFVWWNTNIANAGCPGPAVRYLFSFTVYARHGSMNVKMLSF